MPQPAWGPTFQPLSQRARLQAASSKALRLRHADARAGFIQRPPRKVCVGGTWPPALTRDLCRALRPTPLAHQPPAPSGQPEQAAGSRRAIPIGRLPPFKCTPGRQNDVSPNTPAPPSRTTPAPLGRRVKARRQRSPPVPWPSWPPPPWRADAVPPRRPGSNLSRFRRLCAQPGASNDLTKLNRSPNVRCATAARRAQTPARRPRSATGAFPASTQAAPEKTAFPPRWPLSRPLLNTAHS